MNMSENLKLYNALETVIREILEDRIDSFDLECKCNRCQLDVLALALNRTLPKYVVKDVGVPYIKAQYMSDQERVNIIRILTEVVQIVNKQRHHD